ncbi:MAG TPA: DoxX family protein [Rariglobus sp.]
MSLLHTLPSRLVSLRTRLQAPAHDTFALALRLVFGWQFFLTGRGKLAHLERTTDFFASLHIPVPGAHALGIGLLECVGGLLLVAGAGTRLFSTLLASTMIVALATAHRGEIATDGLDGLFAAPPFPYLLATAFLIVAGPGRLAVDAWLAARFGRTCQTTPAPR